MTFYEQELRKNRRGAAPRRHLCGRACYVRLNDMNRAKIQFVTGMIASQYNALQLTILNHSEGQVDAFRLRLLGSAWDKDDLTSQFPKRRGAAHLG